MIGSGLGSESPEVMLVMMHVCYGCRAEVIWLVSWGTLFTLVKHFEPSKSDDFWDEDHLYWPENHSIQVLLHDAQECTGMSAVMLL